MAEPDPLEEMLQYFTNSDEEDIPINARGPSIDQRQYKGQLKLQSDYLSGTATYTNRKFRRRFRITKTIFSRSVTTWLIMIIIFCRNRTAVVFWVSVPNRK
ncbi:hypothetical protein PTTG_29621 [Puccinia triticina 1-1 BBBD Race 1]|uniref:Uncharacterized protein n=1 Tax=Puccinia triticina (isolate 1-1 / race 1 (BBBD)) TaxID=630390 RepID=A0A180G341_PUCT1|nr:hypothetical protein PTTG_29621 [Puccinia triticina 1-1 BBBD Race 1]